MRCRQIRDSGRPDRDTVQEGRRMGRDLDVLYGGAEVGGVLDGLEVVDDVPDDVEPVDDALERDDELAPRRLHALLQRLQLALLQPDRRTV
jgi:hypothetical protein